MGRCSSLRAGTNSRLDMYPLRSRSYLLHNSGRCAWASARVVGMGRVVSDGRGGRWGEDEGGARRKVGRGGRWGSNVYFVKMTFASMSSAGVSDDAPPASPAADGPRPPAADFFS